MIITRDSIATPPGEYQGYQKLRTLELEQGGKNSGAVTYNKLCSIFQSQFGLPSASKSHWWKLREALEVYLGNWSWIDHALHFRVCGCSVIVTQPYVYDIPSGASKLRGLGVVFADLTDWAFYYPGSCSCYALIVDSRARGWLVDHERDSTAMEVAGDVFDRKRILCRGCGQPTTPEYRYCANCVKGGH